MKLVQKAEFEKLTARVTALETAMDSKKPIPPLVPRATGSGSVKGNTKKKKK